MKKLLLFAAFSCLFSVNAQVRLVHNVNPGSASSNPSSLFAYNGRLFFTADVSVTRRVLSTNGISLNASSILYNSSFGDPVTFIHYVNFYEYNSKLYFNARSSFTNDLILEITGASNIAIPKYDSNNFATRFGYPVGINDKLIFNPIVSSVLNPLVVDLQTPANSGTLYNIDNTANPTEFTVLGTNCFFAATDAANGRELWKTDGTNSGTSFFANLNVGTSSSNPDQLTLFSSSIVFAATNQFTGRELFITDGTTTGTTILKDINSGSGNANPLDITKIGANLYFSADNGTNGQELWKSNGTNIGTTLIKDINPSGNSNPSKFTLVGSTIYFTADDGTNGVELWKTDGTSTGTVLVKNINPTGSSNPNVLIEYNGKLYFSADNGTNGVQLWVSDGTSIGTTMITVNPSGSSNITNLVFFNNELYFGADAGVGIGKELYAYKDPALATDNFQLSDSRISLFPNPSKNYFELSNELAIEKVEVYSLQGQLVKSFEFQNQYDIANLSKGMYLVKVNTTEGSLSKSLIIE
jgi:ELWxxDGT repeat protein